jgi:Winged helix-turn helix
VIDPSPWANRPHPGRPTVPFKLSPEQRIDVEAALRPDKVERRVFQRGQALLLMADSVPMTDIAKLVGVHIRTVFRWRTRFQCDHPEAKLADAPRSGRPPSLSRPPTAPRS